MKRIALLIAAMMLTGCSASPEMTVIPDNSGKTEETVSSDTAVQTSQTVTEHTPEVKTVTFTAVGDNLIHSSIYKQAKRRAEVADLEYVNYDFSYAYKGVEDLLDTADISVINQETLICNDIFPPDSYPTFNSPCDLGNYMERLGFDVFGCANNHVLDKGAEGFEAALDYYDRREIVRVGAYRNEADRDDLRIVERNGVKTAFLAYTEYTNGLRLPSDTDLCYGSIADEMDIEVALEEVRQASKKADIVIVLLHWGVEDSDVISDNQRILAQRFADAGTDVILGSHPHVLRDIETLTAEDGRKVLCAYSLGNFISAQSVSRNLIGGILNFSVTITDGRKEPAITEFIPIVTHYDSNYANVRLYKLSDYTDELAAAHGVRAEDEFSIDYIHRYLEKHHLYRSPDDDEDKGDTESGE
ncbi:MAG: CapA family protein [Oscillospiraceae bacterium]|nr:CapA family protein [Oscillospiraceae bacterium]